MVSLRLFAITAATVSNMGQASALPDFRNWAPPGEGDVRSPCPALNSLANHDILPRSGKGLTVPVMAEALGEGLNMALDFSLLGASLGVSSSDDPLSLSFDLNDLNHHEGMVEHDGSLSRGDAYFGDNHTFNETIWHQTLAHFENDETVSIEAAAKARWERVITQKELNPDFTYNAKDLVLSYAETSLYLLVLGDSLAAHPPVEWVKVLFEQERFPFKEGWRPPKTPTTMAAVVAMSGLLNAASGETLPEGLEFSETTLEKVLSGDTLEGLVGNLPAIG